MEGGAASSTSVPLLVIAVLLAGMLAAAVGGRTGDGTILVVSSSDGWQVSFVDPSRGVMASVGVGAAPHGIALAPIGTAMGRCGRVVAGPGLVVHRSRRGRAQSERKVSAPFSLDPRWLSHLSARPGRCFRREGREKGAPDRGWGCHLPQPGRAAASASCCARVRAQVTLPAARPGQRRLAARRRRRDDGRHRALARA
jgi:hypothetical protein